MIGKTIAHYQIKEKLGKGGMGEVYRARDTHLDRSVAIKVLPPESVSDPERKRRFVQEAKSASALNHPNIIHIYDIDKADGIDFIAMEYVQGRTLAQIIGRKGMKTIEALNYAVQIADALAAAHAAGIIHRDLKPANVMVTESGLVKVLDFGLAKLVECIPPGESEATLSAPPATELGVVVGTAPYMSPEQAQCKPLDARSDIFSFGSVFYEMLTGQRAFQAGSHALTIASILEKEPKPVGQVTASVPSEIERVLTRCLRKDPQRRWQTMLDLKIALQDLKEESESGKLRAAASASQTKGAERRVWSPILWTLVIVIAAAFMLWKYFKPEPAAQELISERFTYDHGITMSPTLTPDGNFAAYASDRSGGDNLDIYLQHTGGGQATRLTKHEADDYQPSFAPDGSQIVFRSERDGGGLYIVDHFGGSERMLAAGGWAPVFSPDGSAIAYVSLSHSHAPGTQKIFLISPQGGDPQPFLPEYSVRSTQTIAELGFRPLHWSPDGKYLLFSGYEPGSRNLEWWAAPLGGGPPVNIGAVAGLKPRGFLYGLLAWYGQHIYFSAGSMVEGLNIFRVPIGADLKIVPPEQSMISGTSTIVDLSISRDGHLLYPSMIPTEDFISLSMDLNRGTALDQPERITSDATIKGYASLTADGKVLAYATYISWTNHREIRKLNLASGEEISVISETLPNVSNLVISPDGKLIGYVDRDKGEPAGYVGPWENPRARRICDECQIQAFFSDNRSILILYDGTRLVRRDLDTGDQLPILTTGNSQVRQIQNGMDVRLSPDEKWAAFTTAHPDGEVAMYIAPLGDNPVEEQGWIRIPTAGTSPQSPVWSPDGGLLYYLDDRCNGHMCIWAQPLDRRTGQPKGELFSVYHFHRPETSFAGFKNSIYLLGARDKLIVNVWSISSNLYRAKLDTR